MDALIVKLTEGLSGFQIVMLSLGTALFVLMFIVLAVRLALGKTVATLIPFFLISIVMIGYSSIKKFEYNGLVIEIRDISNGTEPPPSSPAARAAFADKLALVAARSPTKDTQADVARAYLAIGDPTKAYDIARTLSPPGTQTALSERLAPVFDAKLKTTLPAEPTQRPTAAQQQEISTLTKHLETSGTLTPEQHVTLARGYIALDKKEDAARTIEAAKRVDPNIAISPKIESALQGTHM
jgi:hypothetical protein